MDAVLHVASASETKKPVHFIGVLASEQAIGASGTCQGAGVGHRHGVGDQRRGELIVNVDRHTVTGILEHAVHKRELRREIASKIGIEISRIADDFAKISSVLSICVSYL